jgi:pimeloyl-ACP methyl ester carboxylesterase
MGTPPYQIGDHVNDLVALMDHLGLSGAVVVGLSVGGLIAQGLYHARPDLAKALILCDTAAKIGNAEMWNDRIAIARDEHRVIFDHLEASLEPYICGQTLTAADFYLYMLSRWDLDKTAMRENRPRLNALLDEIRARPAVAAVIAAQPRRAKPA